MCTPDKFKFPHYRELCWFAARQLLQEVRAAVSPPTALLHGARALYSYLRQWGQQVWGPCGVLPLMGTGGIFIATIIVMNQCLCQGLHLQLVVMITSINNSVMDILSYC